MIWCWLRFHYWLKEPIVGDCVNVNELLSRCYWNDVENNDDDHNVSVGAGFPLIIGTLLYDISQNRK